MNYINKIAETISNNYENATITTATLLSVLTVVLALAVYEYIIYRVVSHRAFYNKSFNITIAIIPFFISTIILCLQADIVITLGTIGALAIIRFRTAVKDPVDMIYILWSIHTGIICGCQLYEVAVLTSVIVTVFLIVFSYVKVGGKSYCLVAHLKKGADTAEFTGCIQQFVKNSRIKSRNYTEKGAHYVVECSLKNPEELESALQKLESIERFSLIEYDMEDIA
ncbi:MAG: DUF4956 domain-containing protein [Lachnospiraceae bacterium]|nr:DUF4956 domain-containing protein [Lachnospiraceae bacterium]